MSLFTIFYQIAEPGGTVVTEDGVRLDNAYVVREFLGRLRNDGDYLGLVDDQGTTLQFLFDAGSNLHWTEIPVAAEKGSYGAWLTFDNLVELIRGLPACFEISAFPAFRFKRFGM